MYLFHLLSFIIKKGTRDMDFQNQTLWTIILTTIFYMDFEMVQSFYDVLVKDLNLVR
jgi:hypothetical protein